MTRPQALSLALAAVLAALATGWMLGRAGHDDASAATASYGSDSERKPLYYRHPMGLPDTSPVPKKDAMGMDYVPVFAGDEAPAVAGTVVLSPEKIQALGVRTEPVRRSTFAGLVRASGTVEIDETRQYAIAPRFEGWVATLYANQTGMRVRAGQPLLAVYSPQLAAARQEYRLADAATRRLAATDPASAASMARLRDAARARLRNWQVSGMQLSGPGNDDDHGNFVLASPANAVVVEKPVVQGASFAAGDTILRLADLSIVWVVAKVPAAQVAGVAVGQPARFESTTLPGRSFEGAVKFVQPVVDAATRTVDVRIAFPNPDGMLRPGLFGTVLLEQPVGASVLSAPRSAVLDTGTRHVVLVQPGPGRFAPREVTVGRRAGERVEILAGLEEGERVLVSANFLIDAESNLQSALEGLDAHAGHGVRTPADEGATPGDAPRSQPGGQAEAPRAGHPPSPTAGTNLGHGEHSQAPTARPAPTPPPPARRAGPDAGDGTERGMDRVPASEPHAGHRAVDAHAGHGVIVPDDAGREGIAAPAMTGTHADHGAH